MHLIFLITKCNAIKKCKLLKKSKTVQMYLWENDVHIKSK